MTAPDLTENMNFKAALVVLTLVLIVGAYMSAEWNTYKHRQINQSLDAVYGVIQHLVSLCLG